MGCIEKDRVAYSNSHFLIIVPFHGKDSNPEKYKYQTSKEYLAVQPVVIQDLKLKVEIFWCIL